MKSLPIGKCLKCGYIASTFECRRCYVNLLCDSCYIPESGHEELLIETYTQHIIDFHQSVDLID